MPRRDDISISHSQLGQIVERSAAEAYVFCAETFRFLLVNRGARENLGYSVEEFRGLTPWALKPLIDETSFRQMVEPLLTGSVDELKFETIHARKDGSAYDVSVHLQLIRSDAGDVFFAAIRDVSDERRLRQSLEEQARELEAALAAKEVLLHEVNHRVKNSLQVVSSLLQLQAGRSTDDRLKAALREAHERVAVVASIHQRLYTSSQHAFLDLAELLGDLVCRVVQHMDVEGKIEVRQSLQPGISLTLDRGVPLALTVSEILTNCVKHAFPGRRTGTIHPELDTPEEGIRIRVTDDGVGLPEGFDPARSAGLGSRIIAALTRQISASLVIESDAGGSRFTIVLPAASQLSEAPGSPTGS